MARTKKICRELNCGQPSIPGLVTGVGLCQFHWDSGNWGLAWAAKCNPEHSEAKAFVAGHPLAK